MADIRITSFIGDLVDLLRQRADIIAITNPSTGVYVVEVSSLLNLTVGKIVTIGGVNYKVTAIDANTPSFTVRSTSAPAGTQYKTGYPFWLHGRFLAADLELKHQADANRKYPIIYLAENYNTEENLDPTQQVGETVTCSIFIMAPANFADWNTVQHYSNVIDAMDTIGNDFITLIKSNPFIQYKEFEQLERIRHPKWGLIREYKGGSDNIFTDNLSGIEMRLSIPIRKAINHCSKYDAWRTKNGISE